VEEGGGVGGVLQRSCRACGYGVCRARGPERPFARCAPGLCGRRRMDVVSSNTADSKVVWYKNTGGNPVSWVPLIVSTSNAIFSVAVDVDGDGLLDVLSASYDNSTLFWNRNTGGSPIVWVQTPMASAAGATMVQAADVNGDGRLDLVCLRVPKCRRGRCRGVVEPGPLLLPHPSPPAPAPIVRSVRSVRHAVVFLAAARSADAVPPPAGPFA
jgi:hypothetical protein